MDHILIPARANELTIEQVAVVNELRRGLLAQGFADVTHQILKRATCRFLADLRLRDVAEWGPGFDPLSTHCSLKTYLAVDVDPAVRRFCVQSGAECVGVDDPRLEELMHSFDAVVALFVFHFSIDAQDLAAMIRLLKPGAFVVGNVYNTRVATRQRLASAFRTAGFQVLRAVDPLQLCTGNEFWLASPDLTLAALRRHLEKYLHAVDLATKAQPPW